jgi:hypothetical protein
MKAFSGTIVMPDGNIKSVFQDLQFPKADLPMEVSAEGILAVITSSHSEKAPSPMVVIEFGISIEVISRPKKAND